MFDSVHGADGDQTGERRGTQHDEFAERGERRLGAPAHDVMTVESTMRSVKSTVETERVRTVSVSSARTTDRAYVAVTIKPFGLNFKELLSRSTIPATERQGESPSGA